MSKRKPCPVLAFGPALRLADAAYRRAAEIAPSPAVMERREALLEAISRVQTLTIPGAIVQLAIAEDRAAMIQDGPAEAGERRKWARQIERLTRSARVVLSERFGTPAEAFDAADYSSVDPFTRA